RTWPVRACLSARRTSPSWRRSAAEGEALREGEGDGASACGVTVENGPAGRRTAPRPPSGRPRRAAGGEGAGRFRHAAAEVFRRGDVGLVDPVGALVDVGL